MVRPRKVKYIRNILMLAIALLMLVGMKNTVFAETATLTIDGSNVNPYVSSSGKGSLGGTWSFVPANGIKNATLTLHNYKGKEIDYSYAPGDFDIVLLGNNVINSITNTTGFGIYYESDGIYTISIKGTGKLTIHSFYHGIEFDSKYSTNDQGAKLVLNANVTIHCDGGALRSGGKAYINSGTLNIVANSFNAVIVNQFIQNGGNVTVTGKGPYSAGVYLGGENSRFEANGGTLVVNSFRRAIEAYKGDLYFNEGSHVTATSIDSWDAALYSFYGQIHFNGGEVKAYAKAFNAFYARKDPNNRFVYFGDFNPGRKMAYFEGTHFNTLTRVDCLSLGNGSMAGYSLADAIYILPKWRASINSQKNVVIKLTNLTPKYGSGPANSVTGIRGETVKVSVRCAKGKKLSALYYYQVKEPSKKTYIDLNKKTFPMPDYDVVVAAKVRDTVKVSKIKLSRTKATLRKGKSFTLRTSIRPSNADNKGVTYKSSNKRVATVSQRGVITAKRNGTTTIIVMSKDGGRKKATCRLSVGYQIDYKLNGGRNPKFNPSTYYKKKITLKDPIRRGYLFKGWYTNRRMTKKITGISKRSKKNYTLYAKWRKVKAPTAPRTTRAVRSGDRIAVTLKKQKNTDGYQIFYATNATFTNQVKSVSTKKLTKTLKGCKKGSKYYIRVRAFQKDSAGKRIYGAYSRVKMVK
ncbi:Ig-like domain-containing protein [Anaerosacchariphilus polymeriproducens]|nr:Ig-like domain-containing protein [Anaerosacchariphilus polymeriproducens]